jgi:hypothetical protein
MLSAPRTAIPFVRPLHPHRGVLVQSIYGGVLITPVVGFDQLIAPILLWFCAGVVAVNVVSVVSVVLPPWHSHYSDVFQIVSGVGKS